MVTKEELSQYTAAELRQAIAEVRKSNIPRYPGFENLPTIIVPRGFVSAVDTAEYLRHIAKTDITEFRRYVQRYGAQQVDDIRLGRV